MMKNCIILRAAPNAGKSTVAKMLVGDAGIICEADEFMYVKGEYKFAPNKLGIAHSKCFEKFCKACDAETETVVLANTNTTAKEYSKYQTYAEEHGYKVFFLVVEKRHDGVNDHDVPEDKIAEMATRLLGNIKLH